MSVVIPAMNAERTLPQVLCALREAGFDDLVVVDDGSSDETGVVARATGAQVLRNDRPQGPAEARNRGARAAAGDLLVFVDADVAVHGEARARLLEAFRRDPDVDAVFGSYDDDPPARAAVSRYRNLLHHYVHQTAREEAATFWTGLGAVRREAFERLGGFDRRWQDIEDVEFGVRLRRAGGRVRLDRRLLGAHLKAWTLPSMVRTDLRGRAIPWARLILFAGGPADDLNLSVSHRLSALFATAFLVALLAGAAEPRVLWAAAVFLLGFVLVNLRFLRFLARRGGVAFAVSALPYHLLHYAVAVAGYAWVRLVEAARRRVSQAEAGSATEGR